MGFLFGFLPGAAGVFQDFFLAVAGLVLEVTEFVRSLLVRVLVPVVRAVAIGLVQPAFGMLAGLVTGGFRQFDTVDEGLHPTFVIVDDLDGDLFEIFDGMSGGAGQSREGGGQGDGEIGHHTHVCIFAKSNRHPCGGMVWTTIAVGRRFPCARERPCVCPHG